VRTGRSLLKMLALAVVMSAVGASSATALPPIKHVFTIVLENENYDSTFGAGSKAPYLSKTLPAQGELLTQYFGTGHASLDNYIAMVSGQGPNPITQADCQFYTDLLPGTIGADGQASGMGCVYPSSVLTVGNQLQSAGLTWRAYGEDMANSTTQAHECRHPALNSQDTTQSAKAGDQYAARHEPFVYFHSIIDDANGCASHVTALDPLASDLRSAATTPNYVFITPNLCHDGHDSPCVDGQPGGLVSADQFLQTWIPMIEASPAYRDDGVIAIIFDESATSDATACCGEMSANTPNAGSTTMGPGGGRVGAVILSQYVKPGTVNATPYNHYSLLRTIEDVFGVAHLGYAGVDGLKPFGADVFNATGGGGTGPVLQGPAACRSTRLGASRRAHRGSLIAAAVIVRSHGHTLLAITPAHVVRLYLSMRSGGRALRLASRLLSACRAYRIALPVRHGTVTITASLPHGRSERRVLHA
jgi:phosphatidylinositol-3-phosphatase